MIEGYGRGERERWGGRGEVVDRCMDRKRRREGKDKRDHSDAREEESDTRGRGEESSE